MYDLDVIKSASVVRIGVVIYEAMTPQYGRSVVQVLVVTVNIGVVIFEAMTHLCWRSVVQVLVVRVDIKMLIYEAMRPQCGRSACCICMLTEINKETKSWNYHFNDTDMTLAIP